MYIYRALINALSAHIIHINLNMIFYAHYSTFPSEYILTKSPQSAGLEGLGAGKGEGDGGGGGWGESSEYQTFAKGFEFRPVMAFVLKTVKIPKITYRCIFWRILSCRHPT